MGSHYFSYRLHNLCPPICSLLGSLWVPFSGHVEHSMSMTLTSVSVPTDLSLWGYLGTLTGSASCYRGMKLPVSGLCLFLFPSLLQVSVSLLSRPFPFPSLRAAVFGGDYAVLTLEYELGKRSSQILELGKAGGRQESKSGWDICVAAAPDA